MVSIDIQFEYGFPQDFIVHICIDLIVFGELGCVVNLIKCESSLFPKILESIRDVISYFPF